MARILITGFCSFPAPDRSGVQLGHVVEGLYRDHQVDVLSLRIGEQGHVERQGTTRILRVPLPDGDEATRIESFRRALRRQLEGDHYEVVHFRDGWSGLTALEMQAHASFATVFDVARSPMAETAATDLATATEVERAEHSCVRRADMVLAPTEHARHYLAGLTDSDKIHVVPPGVNVDRFDWEHEEPSEDPPIVLYMGRLTAGRGVRVLLRAMVSVAQQSEAQLVLAGPATDVFLEALQTSIDEMGLSERVRVLGAVPNHLAPAVISRAHVCVAPGASELDSRPTALYPTKLLEYMACKRAVVAPRRGTVSSLLRDKQQGLLFNPGSPEDLAAKVLALLQQPERRAEIAEAGYQLVRSHYSASATRRSLRTAYGWLSQQERFRQRFEREFASESRTHSTTEVGLDILERPFAPVAEPLSFDGDTVFMDGDLSESVQLEGGDVTRVEVHPLAAREGGSFDKTQSFASQDFSEDVAEAEPTDGWADALIESVDIDMALEEESIEAEPIDTGAIEAQEPLPVAGEGEDSDLADATIIQDDAVLGDSMEEESIEEDAPLKTVITAPPDASLVSGVVGGDKGTRKPGLVKPPGPNTPGLKASMLPPLPEPKPLSKVMVAVDDLKTKVVTTPIPPEDTTSDAKAEPLVPRAPKLPRRAAKDKEASSERGGDSK